MGSLVEVRWNTICFFCCHCLNIISFNMGVSRQFQLTIYSIVIPDIMNEPWRA